MLFDKNGGFNSASGGVNSGVATNPHNRLLDKQPFRDDKPYGEAKDPHSARNPYDTKNPYDKKSVYGSENVYGNPGSREIKPFKRFSDLKLLNAQMINLANNMQSQESPLEVLSQGQKGEIKVLLETRLLKLSFIPAIVSFFLAILLVVSDYFLLTLLGYSFYVFILGRLFFFPAKLFYENIRYKTSKYAILYYEEVDFWFKLGTINTIISLIIVSLLCIVGAFFEREALETIVHYTSTAQGRVGDFLNNYIEKINFQNSLIFLFFFNIATLFGYFKFINAEKKKNEDLRTVREKSIRNETMSRVSQIQADKNEIKTDE